MIKPTSAPYIFGDRKHWIKIKPDYIDGLIDTLDLVVIGGYYGEGRRRAGNISHFLLAVAQGIYI